MSTVTQEEQIAALQVIVSRLYDCTQEIAKLTAAHDEDGEPVEVDIGAVLVAKIHELASTATMYAAAVPEHLPVPWEVHFALQSEFVKLARLLGVEIAHNTTFKDAVEKCQGVARSAAVKAEDVDNALALLDGAEDALKYALDMATVAPEAAPDLERSLRALRRALPLLRKLAGKEA